jgi:hypothetical protein
MTTMHHADATSDARQYGGRNLQSKKELALREARKSHPVETGIRVSIAFTGGAGTVEPTLPRITAFSDIR